MWWKNIPKSNADGPQCNCTHCVIASHPVITEWSQTFVVQIFIELSYKCPNCFIHSVRLLLKKQNSQSGHEEVNFLRLVCTSTSTSTRTVMFMLGENEKGMNNSALVLYGGEQRRDTHASYIKACEHAQLKDTKTNSLSSCSQALPEYSLIPFTQIHSWRTLWWQNRRGRQFSCPSAAEILQALIAPPNKATAT